MDAVWINFVYNPLLPIGIVICLFAVLAFLLFLRGFLSGVLYLFTLNGNDEFLQPARIRVFWAFMLLVFLWSVWQMFLWLGALLTGGPTPPGFGLAIVFFILLLIARWGARFLEKNLKP